MTEAWDRLSESQVRRELRGHIEVARASWKHAQEWAEGLTIAQLRQAAKLQVCGDAGIAVTNELGRRKAAAA